METPIENKTVTRDDVAAAFKRAPVCWSWNSKNPKYIHFSVDKGSNTPVSVMFHFADARQFLYAANICSGYTFWELAPGTGYSTESTRHASALEHRPATTGKPKTQAITWKTITLETAKQAVRAYNEQVWNEGGLSRCNLDIDAEARALFAQGLGRSVKEILRQVEFIGRGGSWGYGGVAGYQAALKLAPLIATDIYKSRSGYEQAASSALPLLRHIPSRNTIETLYAPFVKPLDGKRNWLIWATKFWHFLNPDAFPIEDKRVHIFFGIDEPNSVDKYLNFCNTFRRFALSHQGWLPELRQLDRGSAWCDNKIWDKMCYSLPDLKSH